MEHTKYRAACVYMVITNSTDAFKDLRAMIFGTKVNTVRYLFKPFWYLEPQIKW